MLERPAETLKLIVTLTSVFAGVRSTGRKLVATKVARWPAGTVMITPLVEDETGAGVVFVSLFTFHWSWAWTANGDTSARQRAKRSAFGRERDETESTDFI